MATTVYEQVEIALQDGTAVTLKPLAIGRLRRFMSEWERFKDMSEDNDISLDIFIKCSGIALENELKDKIDNRFDPDTKKMTEEYQEYLEDVLDMDTIYKIIEICGGMKLNDPNLLAAAQAAVEAGKN
jgi:hypothetical protein